ncbi:hypothetical protein ACFVW8_01690 [Streptomyces sp. NPDC058221]|uniref:hypothetical protein n=1 Tax=Streptomyces sp. NPDC058221 TaxID=3346388 RepID=UPI0036E69762
MTVPPRRTTAPPWRSDGSTAQVRDGAAAPPTRVLRGRARIDHVLVGGDFSVRPARFLRLAGTDHRALLVALELHDGR